MAADRVVAAALRAPCRLPQRLLVPRQACRALHCSISAANAAKGAKGPTQPKGGVFAGIMAAGMAARNARNQAVKQTSNRSPLSGRKDTSRPGPAATKSPRTTPAPKTRRDPPVDPRANRNAPLKSSPHRESPKPRKAEQPDTRKSEPRQPELKPASASIRQKSKQPIEAPVPVLKKPKVPRAVKEVSFKKAVIALPKFVTLTNLADILKVRFVDLQNRMKDLGFNEVSHDFILDEETAHLIADELGYEVVISDTQGEDLFAAAPPADMSTVPLRPPIVTIMGHVDHGKTTVLDYLRKSSVAASEHGGITQHIGAFSVKISKSSREICFLDTPGHAAFLNMRQRGANVTDIVILIVAADDSVMPQTKEAIKHAHAANVPIIVAINKIDRPDANPEKVLSDLAANGVDIEEYGGETQTVRVSGKTGQGIDKLEEAILTLSEVLDMRSPKAGNAEGWIIESQVKKGLGSVATVLVRRGTLKRDSVIVAGTHWCKVRMLKDSQGRVVKTAEPGTPVEVFGWKELPDAGDEVLEADSESHAKRVVENREARAMQIKETLDIAAINEKRRQMHLEQELEQERQERLKRGLPLGDSDEAESSTSSGPEKVNFIVKADVSGSVEAVRDSIQGLGNSDIQAAVLYGAVGDVTESDIARAQPSGATILTFNSKVSREVSTAAAKAKVPIVSNTIIYRLLEEVSGMLSSKLQPDIKHKVLGEASVREVFSITTKKSSKPLLIAGIKVTNGALNRKAKVKVLKKGQIVYDGTFSSMKHHKDEVAEAKKDSECGVSFEGWDKFEAGDSIQTYEEIVTPRYL